MSRWKAEAASEGLTFAVWVRMRLDRGSVTVVHAPTPEPLRPKVVVPNEPRRERSQPAPRPEPGRCPVPHAPERVHRRLLAVLVAFAWDTWVPIAVSVAALVLAAISAWYSHEANERAKRAEGRDEERIGREREQAESADHALLVIEPFGATRETDQDNFGLKLRNDGPVPAHKVAVWLVDDDENDVTLKHPDGLALKREEEVRDYGLVMPLGSKPGKLRFALSWDDRGGGGSRVTDVHPTY
jgi:hypothetical protein